MKAFRSPFPCLVHSKRFRPRHASDPTWLQKCQNPHSALQHNQLCAKLDQWPLNGSFRVSIARVALVQRITGSRRCLPDCRKRSGAAVRPNERAAAQLPFAAPGPLSNKGGQHFTPIRGQCSMPIDTHRSASTA